MRIVQFETAVNGRRLGIVAGDEVRDVTSIRPDIRRTTDAFQAADAAGLPLSQIGRPPLIGIVEAVGMLCCGWCLGKLQQSPHHI